MDRASCHVETPRDPFEDVRQFQEFVLLHQPPADILVQNDGHERLMRDALLLGLGFEGSQLLLCKPDG